MNRNLIILAVILIFGIGAFILWQRQSFPVSNQQIGISQNINTERDQLLENDSDKDRSFIEGLRKREFNGGEIKIEEVLPKESNFTPYIISYTSDNLKIYAAMNIPEGIGPFPVILLNHGYYDTQTFQTGDGTNGMATILANNGYITLASDYRGHGKSEGQGGGHQPEYAIDVLNLLASVKNIEKGDANRVGMWGHSMGGETSLRTVEATDAIKALVLWAPTLGGGHSSDNSLMSNLTKIKTPISLHQGLSDTEVDPETSIILSDALKKEGKQLEYFEYEGQDHNFRNLGWDLISERTLDFYNKHLK
ncbi:MAG TPA: alpha/beta fold hydrolase [Candidatus Woesebacteria bacterium]|nr:alpha/beta fold hydrolase [Candidatus Woesebacteria bacterium]